MSPRTRSARLQSRNPGSSSRSNVPSKTEQGDTEDSGVDDASILTGSIENSLTKALRELRQLTKEDAALRKENQNLRAKLEAAEEENQPKRGKKAGPRVSALEGRVKSLEAEIKALKKLNLRDARRDVEELGENLTNGADDSTSYLRTLLRRFRTLVSANSVGDDEKCNICFEDLKVDKATSLPCQHVICTDCFRKLEMSAGGRTCPECRKECPIEDVEVIRYTANSQWDALLEIAAAFTKVDRSGPEDLITSDESDEDMEAPFIENDEPEERTTTSRASSAPADPLRTPDPEEDDPPIQPQNETPSRRKRKLVFTPLSSLSPEPQGLGFYVFISSHFYSFTICRAAPSPLTDISQDSGVQGAAPGSSNPRSFASASPSEKRRRMEELAEAKSLKRPRL
ncbi:hypothetical protein NLI96_g3170 [Meripilus lineatus]|uniref:RING-type domain-containing protein n=1 Tax=Meripilus lineatus TaxID=2056292 RepID=A0AAD5YGV2_9APHY|nr:hypothetical protein NLI96_g3170 [Physisporinus lineatus]